MTKNNSTNPVIQVENFSISFGNKQVVRDLSFQVNKGEIFGLLGSNGSGKTTTLRALLGIYKPSTGKLLIDGQPFSVDRQLKIGYLPEERGLYKKETVIDVMCYFGQLKGLDRKAARQISLDYLKKVDLLEFANTKVVKLSGGQQQKIQLGITIMDNPDILILDEPAKGFDPVNRQLLMDMIFDLNKQGATIIIISHQLDEVEKICGRILLLKDGVAIEYGNVNEIKDRHGCKSINEIFIETYTKKPEEAKNV